MIFDFVDPADKPSKYMGIFLVQHPSYTVVGKEYTFTSDIYSFRILTLEISSNQIPFERDYDLAMKIVYSMRSEIKTFQYILVSPIDFSKNEENS